VNDAPVARQSRGTARPQAGESILRFERRVLGERTPPPSHRQVRRFFSYISMGSNHRREAHPFHEGSPLMPLRLLSRPQTLYRSAMGGAAGAMFSFAPCEIPLQSFVCKISL